MVALDWHRASDGHWLPPGAPLPFGKSVILRGTGYTPGTTTQFILYRVPTKIVSWVCEQRGQLTKWEFARRPAVPAEDQPPLTLETKPPIVLAPGGFFHTHRWQFSDDLKTPQGVTEHWSEIVRTTRFTTLKAALKGGYAGVAATITTDIKTTISDPSFRVELSLPWTRDPHVPTPDTLVTNELEALNEELTQLQIAPPNIDRSTILQTLGDFLPREPQGLELSWQPQYFDLEPDQERSIDLPVFSVGRAAFAFAFVAIDSNDEVIGASEVMVASPNQEGGVTIRFAD